MHNGTLKFSAAKNIQKNVVDIMVTHQISTPDGTTYSKVLPLSLQVVPPEAMGLQYDPTLSLRPDEAKSLMDELWGMGVRPSNGEGSTGQLAATKYHLEDMRDIVKSLMDLKK